MRFLNDSTRRKLIANLANPDWQLLRRLPLGSIAAVADLGAHVGMFSLLARFMHPAAKVMAVEPHVQTYWALRENVDGLDIQTMRAAVGDGSLFCLLGEEAPRKDLSNVYRRLDGEWQDENESRIVRSYSLAFFLDAVVGDSADADTMATVFWKIDIEGAEHFHLTGQEESAAILNSSAGFIFDIHGHWDEQWGWWRPRLERTHRLECWQSMRHSGVITGYRSNHPSITVHPKHWQQIEPVAMN